MAEVGKRLLIVDDDRLIVLMLTDLFSEQYEIISATDGARAIELLHEHEFVGVLSDQMMPRVAGTEVLKEALAVQPNAVRILVTATDRVADISDAVNQAHVHRVIVKPFRALEVSGIVDGAVREVMLERENARLVAELKRLLEELRHREQELEHKLNVRTEELRDVMTHLREQKQPA
jgi:response regulator RpfG family c-di-GMP phosphodiesterase